ncbi:hypothetical protein JHK84_055295 [Glycine max]|nr:hypothetical protein JHK86_008844 [Glycine max]KAG5074064.1 hypothetical protein JHK84_055295 [Glycine max]
MNVKATVLFVVFASCFLFMLYKLMSSWFIDVLVVLFCIGGIEGLQTCLVALLSRWFKHAGESYIKVPFLGAISYLTLAVSPFCITFSILWAVYRNESFAWIGQDILGIALIITCRFRDPSNEVYFCVIPMSKRKRKSHHQTKI